MSDSAPGTADVFPPIPSHDHLARELAEAVERDRERALLDEVKKRAIVTATSYDEFHNRVLCADLTPIASKDLVFKAKVGANKAVSTGLHSSSSGGGGAGALAALSVGFEVGGRADPSATAAAAAQRAISARAAASTTATIRTRADFESAWRKHAGHDDDRWRLLVTVAGTRPSHASTRPHGLARLFHDDLDATFVMEVIRLAMAGCAGGDGGGLAGGGEVLTQLVSCPSFPFALAMMTREEKDKVARWAAATAATARSAGASTSEDDGRVWMQVAMAFGHVEMDGAGR